MNGRFPDVGLFLRAKVFERLGPAQRKVESKEERYMYDTSLADLFLPARIDALISLSQRFGRVLPVYGVILTPNNNSWTCECCKGEACDRPGKHPRVKWVTEASRSSKQIADWCIRFPRANWAIVGGEIIDIADLDRKPGKPDGVLTLKAWEAIHGVLSTVRVATGTGMHVYFQAGSGLRQSANDRLGIDARAAGSGYVLAPGSRHQNGRVYQIVEENELQACPAWLIEELYQNQPDTPILTIDGIHSKEVVGGGVCRKRPQSRYQPTSNPLYAESPVTTQEGQPVTVAFWINVDAQLTAREQGLIELLCRRRAEFDATWRRDRGRESRFPFNSGRATDSEYEGSISFFLRAAGWDAQAIMNAIAAWNRLHGIQMPAYASRYGATITKAFALAKLYSDEPAPTKTKGCWTQGETRERILAAIQAGPRRPKEIVEELKARAQRVNPATVYMALGRLVKTGQILHVGHEYLVAPLPEVDDEVEVMTPEDAQVDLDVLYAEYAAAVATGMFDGDPEAEPVDEEIPPPIMAPPAAERKWSSDRADGKHMHFSLAALKREAKAKRLARPQWVPDRFAEDMERLWAQHAADQAAGKVDEGPFV
jgi:hypothetical protein